MCNKGKILHNNNTYLRNGVCYFAFTSIIYVYSSANVFMLRPVNKFFSI